MFNLWTVLFKTEEGNTVGNRCVEPIKISKTYKNLQELVFYVYFLLQRPLPHNRGLTRTPQAFYVSVQLTATVSELQLTPIFWVL